MLKWCIYCCCDGLCPEHKRESVTHVCLRSVVLDGCIDVQWVGV